MKAKVYRGIISGIVKAPISSEAMQRSLAAALLHKGNTVLDHIGVSNNDLTVQHIICKLGASVEPLSFNTLKISSGFEPQSKIKNLDAIKCGESLLALKMFIPVLALLNQKVVLEGGKTISKYPLYLNYETLKKLNISFSTRNGKAPLRIKGPLNPVDISVDCSYDSHFLTGLLLAYGSLHASGVSITAENLKNDTAVDLTLEVMKQFHMAMPTRKHPETFHFPEQPIPGQVPYETIHCTVESDWTNMAFLLVAAAISGEITINGANPESVQRERKIVEALRDTGSILTVTHDSVYVRKSELNAFLFNTASCPAIFPALIVLAANCKGTSTIEGISSFNREEAERAAKLKFELSKLGIKILEEGDKITVEGGITSGGKVKSHGDDKIAMALAIASLTAVSRVEIGDAEAVDKSYPYFFSDLKKLNIEIEY